MSASQDRNETPWSPTWTEQQWPKTQLSDADTLTSDASAAAGAAAAAAADSSLLDEEAPLLLLPARFAVDSSGCLPPEAANASTAAAIRCLYGSHCLARWAW